jgi:hypothetical protein
MVSLSAVTGYLKKRPLIFGDSPHQPVFDVAARRALPDGCGIDLVAAVALLLGTKPDIVIGLAFGSFSFLLHGPAIHLAMCFKRDADLAALLLRAAFPGFFFFERFFQQVAP